MINKPEYREELGVDPDFTGFEIFRTDDDVSASKVRNALMIDDEKTFNRMTPKSIHKFYKTLQDTLQPVKENYNMKNLKSLNEFISANTYKETNEVNERMSFNESKNKFKITDFPEGLKILFKDGEEWIVVKKGMRGSGSWRKGDEITIKPFNKLAKDKNVSLSIDVNLEFLNANVKEINESVIKEGKSTEILINNLSDIDHTRITKWLHSNINDDKYDLKRKKGKDFVLDISKASSSEIDSIKNYLSSQSYINESKDESEVNERNTKLYVYPSSKKDHQMISNWLDRSAFHAEEDSNSFMFPVSDQRDADATEKELDKEFAKLGANARFVLESQS
jgi:hypothetical protein